MVVDTCSPMKLEVQEAKDVKCFSPIAISLGSYMDKAAGRRACTGKKITQDVSVLSR